MLSEIGSNFWLNPNQQLKDRPIGTPEQFNCYGSDYVWLSTGRSAIRLVINNIEERNSEQKKVAVLPSFTCNTVFEPFLNAGYEVFYYPVERDLTTTSDDIMRTAIEHDASIVLFHRFFGFDTIAGKVNEMCVKFREIGKYTIEDCTQCLYSEIPRAQSDFTVGSIRKWIGTPDGGFAVCREGKISGKPLQADMVLEESKIKASYAKYRYLFENKGNKSVMLSMYREAENILDNQKELYAISTMSARVQENLDKKELIRKRRDNYNILRKSLTFRYLQPLFSIENNREVPLYFPILVEDRPTLQKHLRDNAIYAPVVWPKDVHQILQCDGAENAYKHLLCIPIDQRYDAEDMNRIVEVINQFYRK